MSPEDTRPAFDIAALRHRDAQLRGRPAPPPRWSPSTTPAPNLGAQVGVIARALGKPLQPWQTDAAARITELTSPAERLTFRWPLVTVQIPRQAGKTVLAAMLMISRALLRPGSDIRHTAQLGKDATEMWEHMRDWLTADESPFRNHVTAKSGKGDQVLTFDNGSEIRPFPAGREAGHGKSPDMVFIDEAWAFKGDTGDELLTAVRPSMITRRDRQLVIMSAAGDPDSIWWDDLVARGRAGGDINSAHCHIEYAPDDDADPYDPQTWEYHPSLGHLISLTDLAGEAAGPQEPFMRSYLNISTRRTAGVLDLTIWDALVGDVPIPDNPEGVHWGLDVALDRTAASIWAAWFDDDGHAYITPHHTAPGWEWSIDAAAEILHAGLPLAIDNGGPSRLVIDALQRRALAPDILTGSAAALAWTGFLASVDSHAVTHNGSPAIRDAIIAARTRTSGDVTTLSRRASHAPIDSLVAAVVALHSARPTQAREPQVF